MDLISSTILAGVAYDLVKHGVNISVDSIKNKLKKWLIKDEEAKFIAEKLNNFEITKDQSEFHIEEKIKNSTELMSLIGNIDPRIQNTIIQNHSGKGHNIGIINKNEG